MVVKHSLSTLNHFSFTFKIVEPCCVGTSNSFWELSYELEKKDNAQKGVSKAGWGLLPPNIYCQDYYLQGVLVVGGNILFHCWRNVNKKRPTSMILARCLLIPLSEHKGLIIKSILFFSPIQCWNGLYKRVLKNSFFLWKHTFCSLSAISTQPIHTIIILHESTSYTVFILNIYISEHNFSLSLKWNFGKSSCEYWMFQTILFSFFFKNYF